MTRTVSTIDRATLPDDVEALKELVCDLLDENASLSHRLQNLIRQRFGQSAERISRDQLMLFAREILEGGNTEPSPPPEIVVKQHNRNGRRKLPRNLPRIRVEHDVPECEKSCPDCGEMRTPFGEEISEQLEYEPAKMHVIEHARLKYVCKACEGNIAIADKPRQPIEKCLAGPGLLAQVVVNKYSDHQPLHRLEKILKRNGVDLQRSTMRDWMAGCAAALKPLQDLMRRRVLKSAVIHTDDTPVPVQEKGRGSTRQGRFWVYVGDRDNRYAVFDYTADRTATGPQGWLKSYEGYLQADAYAGYEALYGTGKVHEVACGRTRAASSTRHGRPIWASVCRRSRGSERCTASSATLANGSSSRSRSSRCAGLLRSAARTVPHVDERAGRAPQESDGCGARVRAFTVGRVHAIHHIRDPRNRQQPGREHAATRGPGPKELALRW